MDINRTKELTKNDILCLTEIQITNDIDGADIFYQLITIKVYFNSCGARQQNLAPRLGQNIVLLKHEAFSGVLIIDIRKDSFSHDIISVMLLYRSSNFPFTSFYNTSENVLSDSIFNIS